jgi:hypothetical protein
MFHVLLVTIAKDSTTASFADTYVRTLKTELKDADTDFLRAPEGDSGNEYDDEDDYDEDDEEQQRKNMKRSKAIREKISTTELERQLVEKSRNRVSTASIDSMFASN